jgi:hypothetical protein
MARNLWVQERSVGEILDRRELAELLKTSYDLVVAKLPKSKQPGAAKTARQSPSRRRPSPRSRGAARRSGPGGR